MKIVFVNPPNIRSNTSTANNDFTIKEFVVPKFLSKIKWSEKVFKGLEHITGLGGHPPLNTEKIQETFKHNIKDIINESIAHEKQAIEAYYELLQEVQDKSIALEEYCRNMICIEEQDYQEMVKMLTD